MTLRGYDKDLGDEVNDETSGDLNKLLVELIKVIYDNNVFFVFSVHN
jgi:hypothetical protein